MIRPVSERKMSSDSAVAQIRSVLVPVDLTPSADRVVGRVALLPLAQDARVTLVHVVPASFQVREQRRAERDARKALAEEARHLRGQLPRKISIERWVKVGVAAKQIAACAAEAKAELIVMGRGGSRVLRETFLGSTAERVVRRTRRPVLVVRLAARKPYSRPALALDLNAAAHEIIRVLLLVLPPPRPRLEVIHAFDVPYNSLVYPSLSRTDAQERESELRADVTVRLTKLLRTTLAKANIPPEQAPFWNTHVRHDSPHSLVTKVVDKSETDLLVLGTHGHAGAAYVFLGSVAGDLLRAAKCDVLIVPPTSH